MSTHTKEDLHRIEALKQEFDSLGRKLPLAKSLLCVRCGGPFKSRKSTTMFCSQKCRRLKHYRDRVKAGVCPQCGEQPAVKGHVLCKKCRAKNRLKLYHRKNGTLPIPKNPKCSRCGTTEANRFAWHHVVPRRISNDDSERNLGLFCHTCHHLIEEETVRFLWKYFLNNENEPRIMLDKIIGGEQTVY